MANNSTLSSYELLVVTSLDALKGTLSASFTFIFVGLLAIVTNTLELITIISNKKLRTRCYFLIAHLSVASIINGVSYVALGLKRVVRAYFMIPEVTTKRMCAGEMFTCSFGQTAIIFLPLATAVDRMYAATRQNSYINKNATFAIISVIIAWMAALLDSSFSFYGSDQNKLVANCNLVSATELLYIVQSSVELTISCLITLCYISLTAVLRWQINMARSRSENIAANKMKKQVKVVKTLGVESSVHLLTQVATRVGLAILTPMSPEARFQYAPFIRLFIILGSGVNLFVFILVNSDFKLAFKRTFCFKNNDVMPFHTANSVELQSYFRKTRI